MVYMRNRKTGMHWWQCGQRIRESGIRWLPTQRWLNSMPLKDRCIFRRWNCRKVWSVSRRKPLKAARLCGGSYYRRDWPGSARMHFGVASVWKDWNFLLRWKIWENMRWRILTAGVRAWTALRICVCIRTIHIFIMMPMHFIREGRMEAFWSNILVKMRYGRFRKK